MTRKAKRYDEGGGVEESKKGIFATKEPKGESAKDERFKSAVEPNIKLPSAKESSGTSYNSEYKEPTSFKEAFSAARKAGDASFTFDGKKFSTEVAKPKSKGIDENEAANEKRMSDVGDKWREEQKVPKATFKQLEQRKTKEKEQALEEVHPETAVMPGPTGLLSKLATATRYSKLAGEPLKRIAGKAKGGSIKSSASSRGDGCAMRGKTRGKIY